MSSISSFFLTCSGVYKSLLKRSPSETEKYIGIGATVFFTGVLALVSSAYAIYTVFDSYIAAIIFGLVWSLMIFNLDRYLVSSMRKSDSKWKDLFHASPRILLALVIAMVISKPLEIKLFDSEIQSELVLIEQERNKEQEAIARSRFQPDIDRLSTKITDAMSLIASEKSKVETLQHEAIKEADGTGGSQLRNMGPIYKIKKAEADKAQLAFVKVRDSIQQFIAVDQAALDNINNTANTTISGLNAASLTGIASRINALSRLGEKHPIIWIASLFITFLFMLVECAPILVKLMSKKGPYDYMIQDLESRQSNKNIKSIAHVALSQQLEIDYNLKTKTAQNNIIIEAENEIFTDVIKQSKEKILNQNNSWQEIKSALKNLRPEY